MKFTEHLVLMRHRDHLRSSVNPSAVIQSHAVHKLTLVCRLRPSPHSTVLL